MSSSSALEVIAGQRPVGGVGLAVERDGQVALLVDVDLDQRHHHGHAQRSGGRRVGRARQR